MLGGVIRADGSGVGAARERAGVEESATRGAAPQVTEIIAHHPPALVKDWFSTPLGRGPRGLAWC